MPAPLLDLARRAVAALERLESANRSPRGCGRPLAADNLVSTEEVARELGCRDSAARELLAAVPPLRCPGRGTRWRWGDVLQALADAGGAEAVRAPRRPTLVALPPPADV